MVATDMLASYDSDDGSRSDDALRTAIICAIGGIVFLGLCSYAVIILRYRARRLSTLRADPWVGNSGPFIPVNGIPQLQVIDLDNVEKQESIDGGNQSFNAVSQSLKSFKSASITRSQSMQQQPSPLDKSARYKRDPLPGLPSARNLEPPPNIDVFLMRSSFAFPENLVQSRRRSTLSRLGVRLGERGAQRGSGEAESGPLYALQEREMARTTGANRLRSRTDAQPAFAGIVSGDVEEGDAGTGPMLRRENAVLIAQLQSELHMLRMERSRRGSFPVEEPPAYEELDESD